VRQARSWLGLTTVLSLLAALPATGGHGTGAPVLASWAGLRPATPNRLPYIGPVPEWEGLVLATGHFRNGILLGPITGALVRDHLLGRPVEY